MKSLRSKAKTTVWGFYTLATGASLGAVAQALLIVLFHKVDVGNEDVGALTIGVDLLLPLGAGLYLIGFWVSGIAFLAWFYAAHKNLRLAGLQPSYASGWTIGGFFVPFLNLVRPYQVMKELWRGSEHLVDAPDDGDWQKREVDPMVLHWWALMIIAGIASRVAAEVGSDSDQLSDMLAGTYAMLVSDGIDVVGVIVAVLLVKKITDFQERARHRWDVPDVEPGADPELDDFRVKGVEPPQDPRFSTRWQRIQNSGGEPLSAIRQTVVGIWSWLAFTVAPENQILQLLDS